MPSLALSVPAAPSHLLGELFAVAWAALCSLLALQKSYGPAPKSVVGKTQRADKSEGTPKVELSDAK